MTLPKPSIDTRRRLLEALGLTGRGTVSWTTRSGEPQLLVHLFARTSLPEADRIEMFEGYAVVYQIRPPIVISNHPNVR